MNTRVSSVAVNAQLDALGAQANNGYLRIYNSEQPPTPETAPGATLLAELRFGNPAFGAAANKIMTSNPITDDPAAPASGNASWLRVVKSDGVTALWDGSVGTSGANLNLNSIAIQAGARVSVSGLTVTLPMQGS